MIKLTFADLLVKKVIQARAEEIGGFFSSSKKLYVRRGENHGRITLKPHEKVITNIVYTEELELKVLARIFYKAIGSLSSYRDDYVREYLCQKGYVCQDCVKFLYIIPYYKFVLTEKGNEVKSKVENLINQVDQLPDWLKTDPERAKAYLSVIGINLLLLNPYYVELVEQWSRELPRVKSEIAHYYDYYWYDYTWRHQIFEALQDTEPLDFELPDFDFIDFDILDSVGSFSDFDSAFDGGFSGDSGGGDGGGDGGGGGD